MAIHNLQASLSLVRAAAHLAGQLGPAFEHFPTDVLRGVIRDCIGATGGFRAAMMAMPSDAQQHNFYRFVAKLGGALLMQWYSWMHSEQRI